MRFKTRLLGIYAILCVLVAGSIAVLYYHYNQKLYKETEQQLLNNNSAHLVNEFNLILENMEFATTYVVGENEFLDSLNLLLRNQGNKNCPIYYKQEALLNIKKALSRDFLTKNFYAVQVYNKDGMMIEYDSVLETLMGHEQQIAEAKPWISEVDYSKDPVVLTARHTVEDGDEKIPVISMVRKILGYDAYIEVQYPVKKIEEQIELKDNIEALLILDEKGSILCEKGKQKTEELKKMQIKMPFAVSSVKDYNVKLFTIGDLEQQEKKLGEIRNTSMIIAILTALLLFIYINISAEILTKPVKKLQKIMEITEFERMDEEIEFDSQIRELDDLAHSYTMLMKRLQKSMIRNKKMEQLYLKAQIDSLQSKISPHFMANILNVISSRGLELGDREICQISSCMGSLLRYSTDSRTQEVRVKEEIRYLQDYCYLMKSRYMEKLTYKIEIYKEVYDQLIPKLSLQQLVENSIKHGFKERSSTMEIYVQGWVKDDRWGISVKDNGQGISKEQIQDILKMAEEKKEQIQRQDKNIELSLGGMGLVNLYLRLFFQYGDQMIFEIKSNLKGTEIVIGGNLSDRML